MSSFIDLGKEVGNFVGEITKMVEKEENGQTLDIRPKLLLEILQSAHTTGQRIGIKLASMSKAEAPKTPLRITPTRKTSAPSSSKTKPTTMRTSTARTSTNKPTTTTVFTTTEKSIVATSPFISVDGLYSSTYTIPIATLLIILWCASAMFLLRKCFKKRPKQKFFDVEMPLIARNENNSYLHERIEDLNYDLSFEIDRQNIEMGSYLGEGHFGAVYEGKLNVSQQWPCRSPNRCLHGVFGGNKKIIVAVKTAGDAVSPEDVELRKKIMEDELKLMCSVGSHPNVVTLIGAITRQCNPQGVQIIMEKCNSGSLIKYLILQRATFVPQFERNWTHAPLEDSYENSMSNNKRRKTTLPVTYRPQEKRVNVHLAPANSICTAHLMSFGMQIAQGMEYLAFNKCLHRDLAARNILLTTEGVCKIADFGLAKRIGYQEYYRPHRVQHLPERWMAVECLKDRKFTIDSDIWSYGILLYEIFTLAGTPYPNVQHADVAEQVIAGIRNDQPEYCPDEIYHHMTRCWDFDKTKRPSFRDSVNLLKKHLSQASSQLLERVKLETQSEAKRQKQIEDLRLQGQLAKNK